MSNVKETVDYILKNIPREVWGKVKSDAFDNGLTAREWLFEAIETKLKKEEQHAEDDHRD